MEDSIRHAELGKLIWESPTARPAPKPVTYFVSGLFVVLAFLLSIAVVPAIVNARDARDRNAGLAGSVVILALAGTGAWIFIRAKGPWKLRGVQFFEGGVEFGPPKNRRGFVYADLEQIHFEPVSNVSHQVNRAAAVARLTVSVMAGNPAGIGYAVSKLVAEKVEAFAIIKVTGEREFRVAMFDGAATRLMPFVEGARRRTGVA
jgi:hypothetical protein